MTATADTPDPDDRGPSNLPPGLQAPDTTFDSNLYVAQSYVRRLFALVETIPTSMERDVSWKMVSRLSHFNGNLADLLFCLDNLLAVVTGKEDDDSID